MYKSWVLKLVVFTCGALVMAFEIIGSRILSPFLGTSTYTWTSLIGVILGALSLGYWLGGRLADRKPDPKLLAAMLITASGLISLTALIKEVLLSIIAGLSVGLEIKAVIAAVLLFAPASICLGFVAPFAVRLEMRGVESTGRTVGNLYAISTIGSILGTFLAGFFLIPFVGSVRTLYIIAGLLFALAVALVPFSISRTAITSAILFVFGVLSTEAGLWMQRVNSELHDIDTEYSRVQVFRSKDPRTGDAIRALATDPYFVQSAMYLESDELVLDYSRYYHLLRHYKPDFKKTLLIGGAGYSFPKEYLREYPHATIDVVEIDPRMTQIARDFFNLKEDPRLTITHEDGRMFANRTESNKYDVILMDAFGSLFSVPTHLTTIEAVQQFSRVLTHDGVVIFNLGSSISGSGSGFLDAQLATYRAVFPRVDVYKVNETYTDERLQNIVIAASKSVQEPSVEPGSDIASLLAHRYQVGSGGRAVLTDDLAPVEYYNAIAQRYYFAQR